MSNVIPFPTRRRVENWNCARCGSLLDDDPHNCDAALDAQRSILLANGWTADDPELPAHLQALIHKGPPSDEPPPEAA